MLYNTVYRELIITLKDRREIIMRIQTALNILNIDILSKSYVQVKYRAEYNKYEKDLSVSGGQMKSLIDIAYETLLAEIEYNEEEGEIQS